MLVEKLMKDVFVDFIRENLQKDERIMIIDADLAKCIGSYPLEKEFPDRALNVGISEQNMASVAAGLASYGFIPFITSFGPFATRRICDQIMISICYARQNVKIVGTDPGISAELNGGTHMALEDIGVLRSIPHIVIYEPTDNVEFAAMLPQIRDHVGPVYIRMFRKCPPPVYKEDEKGFDLFKAKVYKEGKDVSLIASGLMVSTAIEAAGLLEKEGISAEVIVCPTIKPIDAATVIASAKKTRAVVTCENHNVMGALRSAVAEVLSEECPTVLQSVGVKEQFGEVGKINYLRKVFHMEAADIVAAAKKAITQKI
jgi:transketolase